MNRRNVILGVTLALIVTTFGCASRQQPSDKNTKTGTALEPLPANIEGVEVVGDTLRKKAGFEWAKQADGSLMVRRMASAPEDDVIIIACGCDTGPHACEGVYTDKDTYRCQRTPGSSCLSCKFKRPKI